MIAPMRNFRTPHSSWCVALRGLTLCSTLCLTSCAVGPDFHRPDAPHVDHYIAVDHEAATLATPGGNMQLNAGDDIPAQWWQVFHSPKLDQLVSDALHHNPQLASAQAALRQAQQLLAAQHGSYLPVVQANYTAVRQRDAATLSPVLNGDAPPSLYNLHTARVDVAYALDLFGGVRRQVETLAASTDYQRYQLEATHLTIASNVVLAVIQQAADTAQLDASQTILAEQQKILRIMERQHDLGMISATELAAQTSLVANTEATIPAQEKQLAQTRNWLAVLTGQLPADSQPITIALDDLSLPDKLPLSLPSQLVEHRPDIKAAEATLHAATAQVGVTVASMLPQISLNASAGGTATQWRDMLKQSNMFWSAGASLSQALFAGGSLVHRKHAAEAALDQAAADYRSVVLAAFQNVADSLEALHLDEQSLEAAQHALTAAQQMRDLARTNQQLGTLSSLAVLNAEQAYQQALTTLIQMRAQRYADITALFQALGGGWWNRDTPAS